MSAQPPIVDVGPPLPVLPPAVTLLLAQRNWMYVHRDNTVYNVARSTYEGLRIADIESQIYAAGFPAGVPLPPPVPAGQADLTDKQIEEYIMENPSNPVQEMEDVIERVDATTTVVSKRPKQQNMENKSGAIPIESNQPIEPETPSESEPEEPSESDEEETQEGEEGEEPVVKSKSRSRRKS